MGGIGSVTSDGYQCRQRFISNGPTNVLDYATADRPWRGSEGYGTGCAMWSRCSKFTDMLIKAAGKPSLTVALSFLGSAGDGAAVKTLLDHGAVRTDSDLRAH